MYWNDVAARSIPRIERVFVRCKSGSRMTSKKSSTPSPESIARANRQRIAAEEGLQAMAEVERQALAVRKNMQRLRALREAKAAEPPSDELAIGKAVAKPKRKKPVPKSLPK
jgi:hypothetical protein